jgi:hypothetical protein
MSASAAPVSRTPWISLLGTQNGCIQQAPPFSPNPCAVTEFREHIVEVFRDGHAILIDTAQANAGPPVSKIVEGRLTAAAMQLLGEQLDRSQIGFGTVACNPFRASEPLGDYRLSWYGRNGRRNSVPLRSLAPVSCSAELSDLYVLLISLGDSIVPDR